MQKVKIMCKFFERKREDFKSKCRTEIETLSEFDLTQLGESSQALKQTIQDFIDRIKTRLDCEDTRLDELMYYKNLLYHMNYVFQNLLDSKKLTEEKLKIINEFLFINKKFLLYLGIFSISCIDIGVITIIAVGIVTCVGSIATGGVLPGVLGLATLTIFGIGCFFSPVSLQAHLNLSGHLKCGSKFREPIRDICATLKKRLTPQ